MSRLLPFMRFRSECLVSLATVAMVSAAVMQAACFGGETEPELPQWWEGTWKAVSINGSALPVRVQLTRYDTVTFDLADRFSTVTFDVTTYTPVFPVGATRRLCSAMVNVTSSSTTLSTTVNQEITSCGASWYAHAMTRGTQDTLAFTYAGQEFKVVKQ
jgi:uncharacterized protein YpuA (DUF1002 family)